MQWVKIHYICSIYNFIIIFLRSPVENGRETNSLFWKLENKERIIYTTFLKWIIPVGRQIVDDGKRLFIKLFQLTNEKKIKLEYHLLTMQIIEVIMNKFILTYLTMDKCFDKHNLPQFLVSKKKTEIANPWWLS